MPNLRRDAAVLLLIVGMNGLTRQEASAGEWISSSGAAVSAGDYGTSDDTTITQLSQGVTYRMPRGEWGVVVPYLFRSGGGAVPGESGRVRGGAIPEDADGIGDVRLKGKALWLEETPGRPSVDWSGFVKLPTASEEEGLGTGRFDVGFGPELAKQFGALLTWCEVALVLRDRPSDSDLKSVRVDYSVGVGYPITPRFTGAVSLEGGTRSSSGADSPLELVFSGSYRLSGAMSVEGHVLAGLTDGSPDLGAGVGLRIRF